MDPVFPRERHGADNNTPDRSKTLCRMLHRRSGPAARMRRCKMLDAPSSWARARPMSAPRNRDALNVSQRAAAPPLSIRWTSLDRRACGSRPSCSPRTRLLRPLRDRARLPEGRPPRRSRPQVGLPMASATPDRASWSAVSARARPNSRIAIRGVFGIRGTRRCAY